jgi:hypothetical protein
MELQLVRFAASAGRVNPLIAAIKWKFQMRSSGRFGGTSVRAARRIPGSAVVSRVQQAPKIAPTHSCVPGFAIISAMMTPPSSGD